MSKLLDELDKLVFEADDDGDDVEKVSHHKKPEEPSHHKKPEVDIEDDNDEDVEKEPSHHADDEGKEDVSGVDKADFKEVGERGQMPNLSDIVKHLEDVERIADSIGELVPSPCAGEAFDVEISLRKAVDQLKKLADVVHKQTKG